MIVGGVPMMFGGAPTITYATWNPNDKDVSITLSGGDLTASSSSGLWKSVRSTIGKSSGKWYWEYKITTATTIVMSAIANINALVTKGFFEDTNAWGYYSQTGLKYTNSGAAAYGTTYSTNDIIGLALDMDAGTITFYKNNVSQGIAFSGLTGAIYAGTSMSSTSITVVANFGATALVYAPPPGFNAGLYT